MSRWTKMTAWHLNPFISFFSFVFTPSFSLLPCSICRSAASLPWTSARGLSSLSPHLRMHGNERLLPPTGLVPQQGARNQNRNPSAWTRPTEPSKGAGCQPPRQRTRLSRQLKWRGVGEGTSRVSGERDASTACMKEGGRHQGRREAGRGEEEAVCRFGLRRWFHPWPVLRSGRWGLKKGWKRQGLLIYGNRQASTVAQKLCR